VNRAKLPIFFVLDISQWN